LWIPIGSGFWFGQELEIFLLSFYNKLLNISSQEDNVRQLINMSSKSEIGFVDWEFIHDMQGIVPDLITPELIQLTYEFLDSIPEKWEKIKMQLEPHVSSEKTIYLAIADIENMGNEFKITGTLKNQNGEPLDFHRVVIFDEDRIEDDYIGAVITDKDGNFNLAFGKKTFSDFGIEAEPDIYFKIFAWEHNRFAEIARITPTVFEKTETREEKLIIRFGVVIV
jgi:hypothetical protein